MVFLKTRFYQLAGRRVRPMQEWGTPAEHNSNFNSRYGGENLNPYWWHTHSHHVISGEKQVEGQQGHLGRIGSLTGGKTAGVTSSV